MFLQLLLLNSAVFFGTNSSFFYFEFQTVQYFSTNSCLFIVCCKILQYFWHKFMLIYILQSKLRYFGTNWYSFSCQTSVFGTNSCSYILDCQTIFGKQLMFLYVNFQSLQYVGTNSCSFIFCSQNYSVLTQIRIPITFVVTLQYFGTHSCSFIFCCHTTVFWHKLMPWGRSQPNPADANMDRLHDILEKHEQNIQLHNIKINMTWITLSTCKLFGLYGPKAKPVENHHCFKRSIHKTSCLTLMLKSHKLNLPVCLHILSCLIPTRHNPPVTCCVLPPRAPLLLRPAVRFCLACPVQAQSRMAGGSWVWCYWARWSRSACNSTVLH